MILHLSLINYDHAVIQASRVAFLLYGKVYEKIELLGWVVAQLVDHMGMFLTGSVSFRMWALGTCVYACVRVCMVCECVYSV